MFLIVFSFLIYKYCQHKKRRKDPQNLPLNEVKIDSNGTKTGQNNAENQYQELEVNNNTEDHSETCKDEFKSMFKEENGKFENENQSPKSTIEIFGMLNNNKTNNLRKSIERKSIIRKKFSVKKENRPVLLNNQAIKRHIFPNCCSDAEAVRFSQRRNELSDTLINTVLKIEPFEFHLQQNGRYLCSNRMVQFWQCQRYTFRGSFKVKLYRKKSKLILNFRSQIRDTFMHFLI